MSYSAAEIWTIIVMMGIGTYAIRFSFLGLIGARKMPDWVLRHLRYTPVALLPGLVAPLVVWPDATGGETDPIRLAAAAVTVAVAWRWKNMLLGAFAGAVTLGLLSVTRITTDDQATAVQLDALRVAGYERVFEAHASGGRWGGSELDSGH